MTRKENYERGAKAEERIREFIKKFVSVEKTGDRYPDLTMHIDGQHYGIECKSVLAINAGNGGRKGNITLSSTEISNMNDLPDQNIIPCLVVEVRPPGGPALKSYFYIPWNSVHVKFSERRPRILSLTLYWILQNGENLRMWLSRQCSIPGATTTPGENGGIPS